MSNRENDKMSDEGLVDEEILEQDDTSVEEKEASEMVKIEFNDEDDELFAEVEMTRAEFENLEAHAEEDGIPIEDFLIELISKYAEDHDINLD